MHESKIAAGEAKAEKKLIRLRASDLHKHSRTKLALREKETRALGRAELRALKIVKTEDALEARRRADEVRLETDEKQREAKRYLKKLAADRKLVKTRAADADKIQKEIGNRSVIMLTAHFGPWEAGSTVSLVVPDQTFVAVYHKLTNPVIDELMKRIRQHTNVELVDMKHTMRHFIDNRNKRPMAMGLIADQNPVLRANMHWYKFLHQWTAFFEGGETLALKYHLPVYYFSPKRLSAGHYEGTFTLIYDGEEQVEPYTITERYVRLLENDINANPEMWMWSHRRWKHTPPAELQSQKI
jgi:KDO2-lipid IV(A) lauroyltransferase